MNGLSVGPGVYLYQFHSGYSMKRGFKYLLHLFYWFLFFGWRELAASLFSAEPAFQYEPAFYVGAFMVFMVPFYVNYFVIMERYFRRNKMSRCWVGWISLLLFFIFFRYFIEEYLFTMLFGTHNYSKVTLLFYAFDNVYYGANTILASIFLWAVTNWKAMEEERNSIAKEKNAAELNLLRSQVNPHFLFNTLNNIYSLSYRGSDKAPAAILRLSELMRFMTHEATADVVPLSKEIEYIRGFIELESMRTARETQVVLSVTGNIEENKIAPLILIPFVENGFKHGVVTDAERPFMIRIAVTADAIQLHCSNRIDAKNLGSHRRGTGLANVRKRLDLLYKDRYELDIKEAGDTYICELRISSDDK